MLTTLIRTSNNPGIVRCTPGRAPAWRENIHPHCCEFNGVFVIFDQRGRIKASLTGKIILWPGMPVDAYIYNPPLTLRQHHHGCCLQLLRPGERWFKLHWERPAKTFDEARAYVEQMLAETFVV